MAWNFLPVLDHGVLPGPDPYVLPASDLPDVQAASDVPGVSFVLGSGVPGGPGVPGYPVVLVVPDVPLPGVCDVPVPGDPGCPVVLVVPGDLEVALSLPAGSV